MNTEDAAVPRTGRNWRWMMVYGVLLVIAGIFAMVHPLATGLAVGVLLAVNFLFVGVLSLVAAFKDAGWQAKTVDTLFGILAVLTGILCFLNPFGGAIGIVWIIGILFIVAGGAELAAGFKVGKDKGWLILLGVVDLLLGLWAAFFMQPDAALVTLATLVGLGFMLRGVIVSVLAFTLRGLAKS